MNDITPPLPEPAASQPSVAPDLPIPQQTPAPPQQARKRQLLLPYTLLLIFLITFVSGPLFILGMILPGPMTATKNVIVPRGASTREIAKLLDENGTVIHPLLFRIAARFRAQGLLKAGEYAIAPGLSVLDIADLMRQGKTVLRQVTVPEGLTSYEITTLLRNAPALTGDIDKVPEEGSLWPETYNYSYGDTRASVLARMQKDAREALAEAWEKREAGLPLKSPQEALILASIVEKETGKLAQERPLVAGVFINRLRLNMPLQSDPTTIYALTQGAGSLGRKLTRADLLTPSPMNTYFTAGLPPTPICNPGRASLEAVLRPQKSDFLYFVADGSGGHAFAKNLDEHNRNVAKWISLNRP